MSTPTLALLRLRSAAERALSRWGPALVALSLTPLGVALAQRPNIVWIIADDYSADAGVYGDPVANTPRINQLASEGMRFVNAYSTAPVCSASRSAMMTGVYQTTTGTHNHRTMSKGSLAGDIEPVTDYLEAVGYRTINFNGLGANSKTDFNFTHGNVFDVTGGTSAIPTNQPFFAQVDFSEPHRRFTAPDGDGVNASNVVLPPYYPGSNPTARDDWAKYLDEVFVLDRKLGAFVDWLDTNGFGNNTVVFFFGDHGRPHIWDKQFLWEGGVRVPLIVRWPGQVNANSVNTNLVSLIDLAATTLSLAGVPIPSHMSRSVPFLGPNPGVRSHVFCARDRSGDAFDRIRAVRDARFKYIRNYYPEIPYWSTSRYKGSQYPMWKLSRQLFSSGSLNAVQGRFFTPRRPPEELYDLQADPFELNNLVDVAAHEDKLYELRDALRQWTSETDDEGQTPEPDSVQAAALQTSSNSFRSYVKDPWDLQSDVIETQLQARDWKPAAASARVALRVTRPSAHEAGLRPGEILVVRHGDLSARLDVRLRIGGDAAPGTDYLPIGERVTFDAGQGVIPIAIAPIQNGVADPDRTVRVRLVPDFDAFESDVLEAEVSIVDGPPNGAPTPAREELLEYRFSIGSFQRQPGTVAVDASDYVATGSGSGVSQQNGNAFVRTNATASNLASAISSGFYHGFTFDVTPGLRVDLDTVEFDHGGSNSNSSSFQSSVAVFFSTNGFAVPPTAANVAGVSTVTIPAGNGTKDYVSRASIALAPIGALAGLTGRIEGRLYFYDNVSANNRINRIDNLAIHGFVTKQDGLDPASYVAFGAGCSGSAGFPALAAEAGSTPRIGAHFATTVQNLPAGSPSLFGVLGFSNTQLGSLSLPFDATLIGMNGCNLLVSHNVIVPLSSTGGAASWVMSLPADGTLLGLPFYQQVFVVDASANALGLTVSNGGAAVIGR